MPTVVLYSYYCNTDKIQKVQWLDSGPPQHCKDDPDGTLGHEIVDIFVKDTINNSSVYIEGKAFDPSTGGNYSLRGGSCQITSSSQTRQNIGFKIPMSIYGINFQTGPEHTGDNIDIIYRPDTIVGSVTKNVNTNDTTLNVDSTVLDAMKIGFYLVLTDGTSYYDEIGMIIDINRDQGTVLTDTGCSKSYDAGTYVAINAYIVRNYPLQLPWMHKICRGVSSSKLMEKGSTIQLRYNNHSGLEKTFKWSYDCVY